MMLITITLSIQIMMTKLHSDDGEALFKRLSKSAALLTGRRPAGSGSDRRSSAARPSGAWSKESNPGRGALHSPPPDWPIPGPFRAEREAGTPRKELAAAEAALQAAKQRAGTLETELAASRAAEAAAERRAVEAAAERRAQQAQAGAAGRQVAEWQQRCAAVEQAAAAADADARREIGGFQR